MYKTAIVEVGLTGAGKGFIAGKLVSKWDCPYFETGERLRKMKSASPDDPSLKNINGHGLAPCDLVKDLVSQWLSENKDADRLIIDGFPRTVNQAEWLVRRLRRYRILTLWFSTPPEICLSRLPRKGRELEDTPENFWKKVEVFKREILPCRDFLRKHSAVIEINREGQDPEEVVLDNISSVFRAFEVENQLMVV